jgi:hypothetical protein
LKGRLCPATNPGSPPQALASRAARALGAALLVAAREGDAGAEGQLLGAGGR